MPYVNHLRLVCSGAFQGVGQPERERFSFRVNLSDPPAASDSFDLGRAQDYAADCVQLFADGRARIGSAALLQEVKLAQIGPDGKYRSEPIIVPVNERGAGGGQISHPTQVSLAVSFGTARRGASGKGRVYLPNPLFAINGASFTIEEPDALAAAAAVGDWLNRLNDVPGVDASAPKVTVASSKGFNSDVTTVRVGRVLDTIRSRRTSLDEAYTPPVPVA